MKTSINDNKLGKRLRRKTGQAIQDFQMIGEGERVMVCISGGKDSFTLLDILKRLRQRAPISFTLRAVHLDQNQPGFPVETLREYLETTGVPFDVKSVLFLKAKPCVDYALGCAGAFSTAMLVNTA